jgi:hypothetical protein
MVSYLHSDRYVADVAPQWEAFGHVPQEEE